MTNWAVADQDPGQRLTVAAEGGDAELDHQQDQDE
jgi:hypothetical protein